MLLIRLTDHSRATLGFHKRYEEKKRPGRRPDKKLLGILKSFGFNGWRVYMQSGSLLYQVMELSEAKPQVESIPSSMPLTESF